MSRPRFELRTFCVLDRCDNQLRHRPVGVLIFVADIMNVYLARRHTSCFTYLLHVARVHKAGTRLTVSCFTLASHLPALYFHLAPGSTMQTTAFNGELIFADYLDLRTGHIQPAPWHPGRAPASEWKETEVIVADLGMHVR